MSFTKSCRQTNQTVICNTFKSYFILILTELWEIRIHLDKLKCTNIGLLGLKIEL